ncbi:MAG: hypothetical protein KJ956_14620, partial [Actinobacteria bacterium]|nr:hypothetical protein [Actinomycetota bacterium]
KIHYYHAGEYALTMDTTWGPSVRDLLPEVGYYGLPFVVTADEARIYLGAFVSETTSASFDFPVIIKEDMANDRIAIEPGYPSSSPPAPDPRNDERILQVFEETGKLVL